jgi:hypothetical protein
MYEKGVKKTYPHGGILALFIRIVKIFPPISQDFHKVGGNVLE